VTVEQARDPHGASEASGTVEAAARRDSARWLTRAHEYGMAAARSLARDVEAIVHSVNEKHVRVTLLPHQGAGPLGKPHSGMTGQVGRAPIRLGLDDPRNQRLTPVALLVNEKTPEKLPRDDQSVACVPQARQWIAVHRDPAHVAPGGTLSTRCHLFGVTLFF
jgi:hypothetical protein